MQLAFNDQLGVPVNPHVHIKTTIPPNKQIINFNISPEQHGHLPQLCHSSNVNYIT